jgi:molybdopterin converting factor small subunit
VRIELPSHLRTLAGVTGEVAIELGGEATLGALFDALEARYPKLRGTIRDHDTGVRRAYMRYFADRRDLSHEALDTPLPDRVSAGEEVFRVVGAIAGG